MNQDAAELLLAWVRRRAAEDGCRWLEESRGRIAAGSPGDLAQAFAQAPRRLGKADLREQVALLRALPLLPHGWHFTRHAAAGVRSSMEALLQAIAFDNPYPAARFDEAQWNAMVLKCLFLGLPVDRIVGLDARRNPALARSVADLVRERRAAGRPPPADAGRCLATT